MRGIPARLLRQTIRELDILLQEFAFFYGEHTRRDYFEDLDASPRTVARRLRAIAARLPDAGDTDA